MQLIPSWAPNIHPMIIHFPIVLVMLAAAADLVHLVRPSLRTLSGTSTWLYSLGALAACAAFLSGRLASSTVFIPGMAHSLIENHEQWALAGTIGLALVAVLRIAARWTRMADGRGARILLVALGVTVAFVIQQTAERGARLVYEQGVGVIPGPVPAASEPLDAPSLDQDSP